MMRKFGIYFLLLLFVSCNKKYEIIDEAYFRTLSIQDTLLNNEKVVVMKIGDSIK